MKFRNDSLALISVGQSRMLTVAQCIQNVLITERAINTGSNFMVGVIPAFNFPVAVVMECQH